MLSRWKLAQANENISFLSSAVHCVYFPCVYCPFFLIHFSGLRTFWQSTISFLPHFSESVLKCSKVLECREIWFCHYCQQWGNYQQYCVNVEGQEIEEIFFFLNDQDLVYVCISLPMKLYFFIPFSVVGNHGILK